MVTKMAVLAITRHGIEIARRIKQRMPEVEVYVPAKHNDGGNDIIWFLEQSTSEWLRLILLIKRATLLS
jgi:hypothetical protein